MVGFFIGVVVGVILHILWRGPVDEDCPANVYGYDCKGDNCDHRPSELYRAKLTMALRREKAQQQRDDDVAFLRGKRGN